MAKTQTQAQAPAKKGITLDETMLHPVCDAQGEPTGVYVARLPHGYAVIVADDSARKSSAGNEYFGVPGFAVMPSPFVADHDLRLKLVMMQTPVKEKPAKATKATRHSVF